MLVGPEQPLLTIQKLIFLLDDFHYQQFVNHLKSSHAHLPLKLIKVIHERLPAFDPHEEICKKVYGNYTEAQRKSFNQLASYTFKLSGYLAINYPAYLTHNRSLIQQRINSGKTEAANYRTHILLDIAERIEDFSSQIFALTFFSQQAYLQKDLSTGMRYTRQVEKAYAAEKQFTDLMADLRGRLNIKSTPRFSNEQLEAEKANLKVHEESPYMVIRLLAQYAQLYLRYSFKPEQLAEKEALQQMEKLEHDMENFSYLVFPFMLDLKSNAAIIKLFSGTVDFGNKQGKKEYKLLEEHYTGIHFWQNYVNLPRVYSTIAQASYYFNLYGAEIHRPDFEKIFDREHRKEIEALVQCCEQMLEKKQFQEIYRNDLINLQLAYAMLLMLQGAKNIQRGIREIETMLTTNQQANLGGVIEGAFYTLMTGYFSLKKYEKCTETLKRYTKATRGKQIFEETDIDIYTYYYLSQWLLTERHQYLVKLQATYQRALEGSAYENQRRTITQLIKYFQVPVGLAEPANA